jgi:hypothetical protein
LRDGFAVEDERAQGEGIRFQARLLCARFITLGNRLVASAGAVPCPRRRSLRLEHLQRSPGAAADLQAEQVLKDNIPDGLIDLRISPARTA